MHDNSYRLMRDAVSLYVPADRKQRVLDVGSRDVHIPVRRTYRDIFCGNPLWSYVGIDIEPGRNVDLVVDTEFEWKAILDASFDVVVSGQCLEHVGPFWEGARAMRRVLVSGGLCVLIVPWSWREHRHPVDCWRMLPDGLGWLMCEWLDFERVECRMSQKDTIFIGRRK